MVNKQFSREQYLLALRYEAARRHLRYFVKETEVKYELTEFHKNYIEIVNLFAYGKIKKLMITVPPQHGKSTISTVNLPSFVFGLNPDLRIAIGSYSSTFASKFNRAIQRKIDNLTYSNLFPETFLNNNSQLSINYLRNSEEFEIVGKKGSLKAVGRGGALTGNPVDMMIMDDVYKDPMEANSPIIRESVWDWYVNVVKTRLHNDSQELIVFTRWHEDDLIGRLQKKETVITIEDINQIENIPKDAWVKINFEAIKRGKPTNLDKRNENEALYPQKHNLEKLLNTEKLDKHGFECLYQGNPSSAEGLLYSKFKTYTNGQYEPKTSKNYTDTADAGDNYLCSICYDVGIDNNIYITDVVYTNEGMEKTEGYVASMLIRNNTKVANIESNNGGKGFARAVDEKTPSRIVVKHFHQSLNKESRIVSNQALVNKLVYMPEDWHIRWPKFYEHITMFKKLFNANKVDDAPDALTGVVEKHDENNNVGIVW